MSYCKEEGKDKYIFASEEDLNQPSKANIADYEEEIDWDCQTCAGMRFMVDSPCSEEFKDSYTYFSKLKNKEPDEEYFNKMEILMDCVKRNPEYFKLDQEEKNEDPSLSQTNNPEKTVDIGENQSKGVIENSQSSETPS